MSRAQRIWLCFPAILLCLLDGVLTLLGQSPQYWAGDFSQANEANPLFEPILQLNPLAFVLGGALYLSVACLAIVCLPRLPTLALAFCIALGHAIGSAAWLARHGGWGWVAGVGVLIAAERLTRWAWGKALAPNQREPMLNF